MKIGIDARMYGKAQSGIGNYIKQLTANIFQLDRKNDFFLFLLDPIFSQYQPPYANITKIKVTSGWYSYSEQTKFLWEINKFKLNLMHFTHFNAPIFYNHKRLTTIHDITPKFFPGHKQKLWWHKKAYQITIASSLRKSAKIITVSNSTKQDLIKHFKMPEEKIAVVYLGIESDFKKIDNYAKIKELKDKYKITKPFLFFVSAWRNHKNFEGLIKAWQLLKKQGDFDYQLVLGGQEDVYYPKIKQTIATSEFNKDIIIPGFISEEELVLFYNAAELFVIPSFYEGFGLIGLEAMACGLPVISSNTTSLPEILGQAAIYFDPYNIENMAETIQSVVKNPELKNQLRQKGLEQVKKYSWQDCAQKTLKIYQQILHQ